MTKKFLADDLISLYSELEAMGIKIWIDGGWCVDALLGEQTREHADLDIAIQYKDLEKFRAHLESKGYKDVPRDDDAKWNFVLGDDHGREVDVHAFSFDENGHVIEGIEYPDDSLKGEGVIDGRSVHCIAPEYMIQFMTPYIDKHPHMQYAEAIKRLTEKYKI